MNSTEIQFTREDTKVIKGISIMLMMIHHLWGFPERIGGTLNYLFDIFGKSSTVYFGLFAKICVSLFFFVGGYGIYKNNKNNSLDIIAKIKGLYLSFWKIFIIFIPIGFLFFSDQPSYCESEYSCHRFAVFSWNELIQNFLAIKTTYNGEWWFLFSYIYAVLTYPVIKKIIDKYSPEINITIVLIGSILVTNFFPSIGSIKLIGTLNDNYLYKSIFCQSAPYIACFWMGCVCAKDDLLIMLNKMMIKNHLLTSLGDILICIVIVYLRNSALGNTMDVVYVPFLIIAFLDFTNRAKFLRNFLLKIGKQSTNMWLIHSFFCYYFYPIVKIVVFPKWAILSLLVLITITYIAAICITCFYKMIGNMIQNYKC